MSATPIIASVISAIVVIGGLVWYSKERKWSDGTRIVYKDEAEQNILDEFRPLMSRKGGRRKKKYTKKHYK
jgi:hypothetical protein